MTVAIERLCAAPRYMHTRTTAGPFLVEGATIRFVLCNHPPGGQNVARRGNLKKALPESRSMDWRRGSAATSGGGPDSRQESAAHPVKALQWVTFRRLGVALPIGCKW